MGGGGLLPPSTEWSKKCMLCGRNGYIIKEQSLLHDWHGKLLGGADWTELSAKYAKMTRGKFSERRIRRKERNEQGGSN
jgi:hypothetical protein